MDFSKSLKNQMLAYFCYRKYILNVNLKHRQMYIFILEQRVPVYSIHDQSQSSEKELFLSLPISGEFYLEELNLNTIELLLYPISFFTNKAIKIFLLFLLKNIKKYGIAHEIK